ncbi:branched-chain amino acid ABC transporter substrate-binding protein [Roseibium sediminis]|uniref:branched-chain amino acid ABC transporter substrate-binding protein n=1 Tax=Roseibium sediminis TaxID=1775174 RepID=UPI00123CAF58|nr:branched-chain amino acid ABC transporter substrate-binding protein [Roseibium sediminis]
MTTALKALGLSILAATCLAGSAMAEIRVGLSGPMSGELAQFGQQMAAGAELAVADINAAGGVLGQKLELVVKDDKCDADEATAVANQMIGSGTPVVIGSFCFRASLAAAPVYAGKDILQISPGTTVPQLTDDRAGPGVFRLAPRDDQQPRVIASHLVKAHGDRRLAILHDKSAYGKALADAVRTELHAQGGKEALYEAVDASSPDYGTIGSILQLDNIEAVFFGGYHPEAAAIRRELASRGMTVAFIGGDALATDEFWLLSGEAGEGTEFALAQDPRSVPSAASLVERLNQSETPARGYDVVTYAAIEAWVAAVRRAGSTDLAPVAAAMMEGGLPTVLGSLSFDDKGDVEQQGYVLYRWNAGRYSAQ